MGTRGAPSEFTVGFTYVHVAGGCNCVGGFRSRHRVACPDGVGGASPRDAAAPAVGGNPTQSARSPAYGGFGGGGSAGNNGECGGGGGGGYAGGQGGAWDGPEIATGGSSFVSDVAAAVAGVGAVEQGDGWVHVWECQPPVALSTGVMVTTAGQAAGAMAYTCKPGYHAAASTGDGVDCVSSACGTWLHVNMECAACAQPPAAPANAVRDCSPGSVCTYTCEPGYYHVSGDAAVACNPSATSGDWYTLFGNGSFSTATPTPVVCSLCGGGHFCDNSSRLECPPGTATGSSSASSIDDCVPCSEGYFRSLPGATACDGASVVGA